MMRKRIVEEILQTEQSYVNSLATVDVRYISFYFLTLLVLQCVGYFQSDLDF
jgi:hypothetical protein